MAGAIEKRAKAQGQSYTERGDCKVTLNALQPRGMAWHQASSPMGPVSEPWEVECLWRGTAEVWHHEIRRVEAGG